ncbi:hypothetical protein COCC4DRAFT_79511 [Bipolaris maydis ATCC 48331]|uniref:Uncharacterized protein n=2 Tax=Cochliobolus heterostrophus TaxID=5016 RepID=M2UKX9_COCH5|nr:uncharacterized protein COCC4DRAFT_79511 [Bipolaris maydis ATCC 48331]EMD94266.1 hypothetical protein COCHEDRAFT_1170123 [Bipolaris maydis C5]KAJ5026560.1 hypothetical protein J3E73DRAFT_211303 [Bipolaris maydis]ENI07436.1 hypothetical protein COCC4DRAFT_79511 [Bipolaris maydis ATCC 48331]KAJ5059714.1 hypothetical protein J3E74DRAFT_466210 [Bipolaris maydis]KAJ6197318.1 hypothetical protein J3E72DRAFT_218050 [Bipolaris maydis]
MKLSGAFLASSLSCAVLAARPTVSPETARLIIAQRLGLSRFHSLEHADADTIHHINTYGGKRQPLFGADDADVSKAHLLVWAEDVDQDEPTVIINDGSDRTLDFSISGAPSASDNDRLIHDFITQAESLPEHPDPQQRTYKSNFEIESALPPKSKSKAYNGYLNMWRIDESSKMTTEELAQVLSNVNKKAEEAGFSTTVVMMPRSSKSKSKRAANPWGIYDVPAMEARRQNPEAVLSATPSTSKVPVLEDFSTIAQADSSKNKKGPVRGILPVCFKSLDACQSQTHNCSSHGECTLLHKGRGSGSNQETVDCYGCACKATVEHVGEDKGMESKKKVTYWGGPACQKKDISVQFWLFVGSGVILAFLVSAGIGMLYSMGAEELPSVIGAGVSGPTARK